MVVQDVPMRVYDCVACVALLSLRVSISVVRCVSMFVLCVFMLSLCDSMIDYVLRYPSGFM